MRYSNMRNLVLFLLVVAGFAGCSNVGNKSISLDFVTVDGDTISQAKLVNKIVVLNVWATWCGTCIREIPELNKLQRKYAQDTTVVFIAICDDTADRLAQAQKHFPFRYYQVLDNGSYAKRLKTRLVKTYPQNLIVDGDGVIQFEKSDGSKDIFSALDDKIKVLKQQSS